MERDITEIASMFALNRFVERRLNTCCSSNTEKEGQSSSRLKEDSIYKDLCVKESVIKMKNLKMQFTVTA